MHAVGMGAGLKNVAIPVIFRLGCFILRPRDDRISRLVLQPLQNRLVNRSAVDHQPLKLYICISVHLLTFWAPGCREETLYLVPKRAVPGFCWGCNLQFGRKRVCVAWVVVDFIAF